MAVLLLIVVVAVMIDIPDSNAIIFPLASTVATSGLLLFHITDLLATVFGITVTARLASSPGKIVRSVLLSFIEISTSFLSF